MNFLEPERAVLDRFLPGLDKRLAALPQPERERPGGPALPLFKAAGGPALLVPAEHQGLGISAEDAVSLQRAVGARSPSLAVATTMHHLSVAGLVQAYEVAQGMEWMLLEAVADQRLLVASGFAEGRPDSRSSTPPSRPTGTATTWSSTAPRSRAACRRPWTC